MKNNVQQQTACPTALVNGQSKVNMRPAGRANERARPVDAEPAAEVDLYLAGVGSVGQALLEQIASMPEGEVRISMIGACTAQRAVWDEDGVSARSVAGGLEGGGQRARWSQILPRLERSRERPLIFVDATGSVEVARHYERLLQAGVHLVTPSKIANTQEQAYFDRLQEAARAGRAHYRYETTVGAGLPIVQTVQDLVDTGDRIREIRGSVSGTLTFLFSELRAGTPFSRAVQKAIGRGYAEPDVRDDLSGEDVARKFIILARTAGLTIERSQLQVESLVPESLRRVAPEAFLEKVPTSDAGWRQRTKRARDKETTLQYVGHLAEGRIRVGVQEVATSSPFGQLQGTDNLLEIYTDRYAATPLVVRGPGAGPQVTAAGVLADVLKVARAVT